QTVHTSHRIRVARGRTRGQSYSHLLRLDPVGRRGVPEDVVDEALRIESPDPLVLPSFVHHRGEVSGLIRNGQIGVRREDGSEQGCARPSTAQEEREDRKRSSSRG